MATFRNDLMARLSDQQVRFAPPPRRLEQVERAGVLAGEIEACREYPYAYVCFKLTEYRPDDSAEVMIPGADLLADLELFALELRRSMPPHPVELSADRMLTLDEVSRQFNVSTKTISRWRMQGLEARHVLRNGRRQLGFPLSSVEEFSASHQTQIARGSRFSHLSNDEKDAIVLKARNLAANGRNLTEVSKTIAKTLGRSIEAVRYTIKNFDRAQPADAVFPARGGPLDATAKVLIYTAFQEGKPMIAIAQRFGRTPSSVYRVVNEVRARRLIETPVELIHTPEFDNVTPAKDAEMLGPMAGEAEFFEKVRSMRPPKDVEAHMAYLYERPLLTREQEAHLFRKMNYLKHKLKTFIATLDASKAKNADLNKIEKAQSQIKGVRDLLIECNQRLVHSLATKHLQPGQNLDELKSDANVSVMRAVEKFDYSRGNKFSTYATWAIMKNFARSIPDENTRKQRYMTGTDELFDSKADIRTDEQEIVAAADQARERVNRLLDFLDPRTREVIKMRTGIDGAQEMTLEQIGQHFGITKERVRQINVRGMKQLRERAASENVELP